MLLIEAPNIFSDDEEWAKYAELLSRLPPADPDVVERIKMAREIFARRQRGKTIH